MVDKVLYVNLSSGACRCERLPQEWLRRYLGGRGLGMRLLFEIAPQGVAPLAAEAPLIITCGALNNTGWPSSAQWHITEKSSLTGGCRSSLAWGDFGIGLHSLGYAALVVTGAAPQPVMLWLEGKQAQLRAAGPWWGTETQTFTAAMKSEHPETTCVAIGPAGEAQIGISSAVADGYMTTLRGAGATMGSKKLKAVVLRPNAQADAICETPHWQRLCNQLQQQVASHPTSVRLREVGKPLFIQSKNTRGDWPTHNHQLTRFTHIDSYDAEAVRKITKGSKACKSCPIACIRETSVGGVNSEGPELEPIWALGARIGNSSLEYLVFLYNRCLQYGVDPTGFGGIVAFAMEGSQRGVFTAEDAMAWGDQEGIERFWANMMAGQGLAGALRGGSGAYCAGHTACTPFAMQVKGVELSAQEPRQSQAFGLNNAVSNWGGDGLYSLPTLDVAHNEEAGRVLFPELLTEALEVMNPAHKADIVFISEWVNAASDSLGVCKFACPESYALMPADLAAGCSAYFGTEYTQADIQTVGERIINLERLYNLREGISPAADGLPSRFLQEPITVELFSGDRLQGLVKTGETVQTVCHLPKMLTEYYALHGWPGGVPSEEKLAQLGLSPEGRDL